MRPHTTLGDEVALLQFVAADGKAQASIVRTGDHYRFVEECERFEPATGGLPGYAYWSETWRSGLYASADEALVAARTELAWLSAAVLRQ